MPGRDGIIYKPEAVWPDVAEMRVQAALAQREVREKAGLPPLFPARLSTNDPNIRFFYSLR
ncbi:hypothetical protein [Streptomyces mirabilis]|uniref:hypothetical protein n=1 Tax=Streptomyces mirabilis TaxID=68239 RepID=UPI0036DEADF6